jgi:phage shock protein A
MKLATNALTYSSIALAIIGSSMTVSTEAFAPIHHPTTARLITPSNAPFHHSASTTAMQANLFDRFFRVSKANANRILTKLEDPEKIIAQAVEDMQNDLVRVRQTYAEVTATQRRLASSKRHLESQAEDWYQRAQLALKKSNDGLAREALARREALLNQAKGIQDQIDAQAGNIDNLYEGMGTLERKIMEAASKKNQLKTRVRTAKTTQKVNDMISGVTGKTSMDAFDRMAEKVMALEAAAEVSTDMAKSAMNTALAPSSSYTDSVSDIEMQFRMLEASDSVDQELEKLRAKVLPPSTTKSVAAERIVIDDSKIIER